MSISVELKNVKTVAIWLTLLSVNIVHSDGDFYKITKSDENFFYKLKKNINNKIWISSHIRFPICIREKEKIAIVKNPDTFIKKYNQIVDKNVKLKIMSAGYSDMRIDWRGVSISNGTLWFDATSDGYLITSINGKYRVPCQSASDPYVEEGP